MRYVIIGNSAAAIGGVEGIRQIDPEGTITLLSDEPYHTYSRPLISYYLAGKVSQDKMAYRDKDFYDRMKVDARLGTRVSSVEDDRNEVVLERGERIPYDRLLIATGGKPFIPPMEGLDKKKIYSFTKLEDVKAVDEEAVEGKEAVIIGAGLIGLKAAEALAYCGVKVTVIELANRVLSTILDEEAASIVQRELESHGIRIITENTVSQIIGKESAEGVVLKDGTQVPCDFLVVAIGVRPNTDVVQGSSIQVGRGIKVNHRMTTNVENVYAAGDCSEGLDILYQENRVIPIWPNAYHQGEMAGINMAGADKVYEGGFPMNSIGFFSSHMITAGIVKLEDEGSEILSITKPEEGLYRRIVLKDNKIMGFIFLGKIQRAGILTNLIREGIDVSEYKDRLLSDSFGYIDFSVEYRKRKMLRGMGS